MTIILRLTSLINKIPESSDENTLAIKFKQPFTETFFKNTENVQKTLRRSIFRYQFSEDRDAEKYQIVLKFFERLETSSLID
jgi:hypothetical protein